MRNLRGRIYTRLRQMGGEFSDLVVSSINGRSGDVTLTSNDIDLSEIEDSIENKLEVTIVDTLADRYLLNLPSPSMVAVKSEGYKLYQYIDQDSPINNSGARVDLDVLTDASVISGDGDTYSGSYASYDESGGLKTDHPSEEIRIITPIDGEWRLTALGNGVSNYWSIPITQDHPSKETGTWIYNGDQGHDDFSSDKVTLDPSTNPNNWFELITSKTPTTDTTNFPERATVVTVGSGTPGQVSETYQIITSNFKSLIAFPDIVNSSPIFHTGELVVVAYVDSGDGYDTGMLMMSSYRFLMAMRKDDSLFDIRLAATHSPITETGSSIALTGGNELTLSYMDGRLASPPDILTIKVYATFDANIPDYS